MSLILKLADKSFSGSLPILYRDAAISANTLFAYDALDVFSYPQQADGGATWFDMSPNAANAVIDAGCGWSGGFTIPTGAAVDKIALASSGKLTGSEAGMLFLVWLKPGPQASGVNSVAGCADNTSSLCQYGIWSDSTVAGRYAMSFNGQSALNVTLTAGSIYQLGISSVKEVDGSYTYQLYQNGAIVRAATNNAGPLKSPTGLPRLGYMGGSFGANWEGTLYRTLLNNTGANAAAIVAADYAANSARFT